MQNDLIDHLNVPLGQPLSMALRENRLFYEEKSRAFSAQSARVSADERETTLKTRFVRKKSDRSLARMNEEIKCNNDILSIFPAWQKQFARLCDNKV